MEYKIGDNLILIQSLPCGFIRKDYFRHSYLAVVPAGFIFKVIDIKDKFLTLSIDSNHFNPDNKYVCEFVDRNADGCFIKDSEVNRLLVNF